MKRRHIIKKFSINCYFISGNGIGISGEDQQHLFQRFSRASNTGDMKGTGLELHTVKKYVDVMGGTISVKSEVNEETGFTVILDVPAIIKLYRNACNVIIH